MTRIENMNLIHQSPLVRSVRACVCVCVCVREREREREIWERARLSVRACEHT